MSARVVAVLLALTFDGGCAYEGTARAAAPRVDRPELSAIRRCIQQSCDDLRRMLQTKLTESRAAKITGVFVRRSDPIVERAVARCRAGSDPACRALWWVLDRLYVGEGASPNRASECALSQAFLEEAEQAEANGPL